MTNSTSTPEMPAVPEPNAAAAQAAAETLATPRAKAKRPVVLIVAAALMLLAAVLSGVSPFLPRVGGFGGAVPGGAGRWPNGQPPAGGRPADGQFMPGQDGGQFPQDGAPAQDGTTTRPRGQGTGQGRVRPGGAFGVMTFLLPVRIGLAVLGALFALLAALGLWGLKKWGRNLAVLVAVGSLISVVLVFVAPLLGRTFPYVMLVSTAAWQAIAGLVLTLAASVLALLPAAQQAYVVKPKVRRVM